MKATKWTAYDACAAVEGFDGETHSEDEILSAWQYLIDTGTVWNLQGFCGRTAADLIRSGQCVDTHNRLGGAK